MNQLWNILNPLTFITMIAFLGIFLYALSQRAAHSSILLSLLAFSTFMYSFGYLLELNASTLEASFAAIRVQYIGLPFHAPLYFLLVRDLYGEKRLDYPKIGALFIIPVLSLICLQAFPAGRLFYAEIEYISNGTVANCQNQPGPLYLLFMVYVYAVVAVTILLIVNHWRRGGAAARRQSTVLLAATLIPLACNLVYLISPSPVRYDSVPVGYIVTMGALLYLIRYHNLLNVVPVARTHVIEIMEDAFIVLDNELRLLDANLAARRLLSLPERLPVGEKPIEGIERLLSQEEAYLSADDVTRCYKIVQTPIQDNGKNLAVCVLFHDITEKENLLKDMHNQATMDPLLHIYNRRAFFELANLAINRRDEDESFALLMIDIDHFKRVNDEYGHLCGDIVLETCASIVKKRFRRDDIVGRYGGEEIVVLLRGISLERAVAAAEVLRKSVDSIEIDYQLKHIHITISIGVSYSSAEEPVSLEEMMAQADAAMYRAKNSGRNRICLCGEVEVTA